MLVARVHAVVLLVLVYSRKAPWFHVKVKLFWRILVFYFNIEPRLKWNKIIFRVLQCVLRCVLCCPWWSAVFRHTRTRCTTSYQYISVKGQRSFHSKVIVEHTQIQPTDCSRRPLPSNRHHRSSGDCLEGKGENYQVCSVQYCVQQLCTVRCTHIWTD